MSEIKHTPGPWKACRDGDCTCGMVWSLPGDFPVFTASGENMSHRIGDAHALMGDAPETVYRGIPQAQAQANARLIAAAPDMLAALTECRKQVAAIIDDGAPTDYAAWLADIDSVIAKAEGRS